MTGDRLTHADAGGRARMVDTSDKDVTRRAATARGRVACASETLQLIAANQIAKGSVLDTARLAGIMAAKRTSDLIPLCHPLALRHVDVDLRLEASPPFSASGPRCPWPLPRTSAPWRSRLAPISENPFATSHALAAATKRASASSPTNTMTSWPTPRLVRTAFTGTSPTAATRQAPITAGANR